MLKNKAIKMPMPELYRVKENTQKLTAVDGSLPYAAVCLSRRQDYLPGSFGDRNLAFY